MSKNGMKQLFLSTLLVGATTFAPVAVALADGTSAPATSPATQATIAEQTAYTACMKRLTGARDQRRGDLMTVDHIPVGGNSNGWGPMLELRDALEHDYLKTVNMLAPESKACEADKRPATLKAIDSMFGTGLGGAK